MPKLPVKIVAAGGGSQPVGAGIGRFSEMVVADANSSQPIPVSIAAMRAVILRDLAPVAWFQHQVGLTVTGAGVSQWNDASGNGRHLKQGTDTNRPALQTDGSVLFDGSDNFLICDAFTYNQPATIYWLGKQVTWTSGDMLWAGQSTSVFLRQTTSSPNIRPVAGTETFGLNNGNLALDTYGVVAVVLNGASSLSQVNNGTVISGDAGATNPGGFTLAALSTPGVYGHTQVKEVILFAAAHDAAQRALVNAYLRAVGGL